MGVIKKQSIQGTILLYIGVFIGFITTAVLFPRILKEDEIGLLNTLLAYANVFAQFATLGFTSVIIKMFAYFRNHDNKHNGFLGLALIVIIIGFLITLVIFSIIKPYIISENIKNAPLFVDYMYYLLPLVFFTLMFIILDNYYTVLFKTVRGLFLKDFLQRVLILVVLLIYFYKLFDFDYFIASYVITLSLPSIIFVGLLFYEKEFVIKPNLTFITKELRNTMISVGLFGLLGSFAGNAIIQIDKAMCSSMLSLKITGIYSTVIVFPLLIKTPSRAILKISMAVIAEFWKQNDREGIKKVYASTSLNQYIIASFFLIGIWANIDNIFRILPPGYELGKYVILIVGLAYTFEMATGVNNTIIGSSKHYKLITWFAIITLVIVIVANLLFIPIWGINGLAIATGLTIVVFNLLKVIFIYLKFKMQPFSSKFLVITLIAGSVYLISTFIPLMNNLYLDILIRSTMITLFYLSLIVALKVSEPINDVYSKIINNVLKRN